MDDRLPHIALRHVHPHLRHFRAEFPRFTWVSLLEAEGLKPPVTTLVTLLIVGHIATTEVLPVLLRMPRLRTARASLKKRNTRKRISFSFFVFHNTKGGVPFNAFIVQNMFMTDVERRCEPSLTVSAHRSQALNLLTSGVPWTALKMAPSIPAPLLSNIFGDIFLGMPELA